VRYFNRQFKGPCGTLLTLGCLLALALPAQALAAAPPTITATSISEITATSALLKASLNPNAKPTTYHAEYITQSAWQADGEAFGLGTESTPSAELPTGTAPVAVSVSIPGLAPATAYRVRLAAQNSKGPSAGEALAFSTYPAAPLFGPCGNDAFRSGPFAPPGEPSAVLPDCRAYEQATPTDKDGGDAIGSLPLLKASLDGGRATFATTAGIPGGLGAQEIPLFRADRAAAAWSTLGLQPPGAEAQRAVIKGWLPDLSLFFVAATRFGTPNTTALLATGSGGASLQITPFVPGAVSIYSYVGASADGSKIVFESTAQLPPQEGAPPLPGSRAGASNVYVYDRSTATLSLASRLNTEAQTDAQVRKGAFAGPYDWAAGKTTEGGAAARYYLQSEHVVAADGSLFFTAAGSGHLYQRLHPTQPQSALDGGGNCTEAAKACTFDLSTSKRAVPDAAGARPAAFQAASLDGQTAFFTSSEKLTDDANTGPEVPEPKLGRATLNGESAATEELPELLKGQHAVGIAISGEHVYWADPVGHSIGRAHLNGANPPDEVEPNFIEAGETCFETHPNSEPGVIHCAPSTPRYLAVANGHLYWTNTGPLGGDTSVKGNFVQLEIPVQGAGTIGRAALDGSGDLVPGSVKPKFIAGASNPQGVGVNAGHVYWIDSCPGGSTCSGHFESIARAGIEGEAIEEDFFEMPNGNIFVPLGLALDATHIYWTANLEQSSFSFGYVFRLPLGGGSPAEREDIVVGENSEPRGIALDGSNLYWAAQGGGAIGRIPLADFTDNTLCGEISTCKPEFVKPGGSLAGLATDDSQAHLFWSANGEISPHPGNDLYRFQAPGAGGCALAGGCLTDLVAVPGAENGAEVKGVLGASSDGRRLYFAANADLDGPGPAQAGDCRGPIGTLSRGLCGLYLWEEDGTAKGRIVFVATLDSTGDSSADLSDSSDWRPNVPEFARDQKQSFVSPSGDTLLFRSQHRLTEYDNQGQREYYLYRIGQSLRCLSCNPTGAPPNKASQASGPDLGSLTPLALRPTIPAVVSSRNLTDDGRRFFFESTEALLAQDKDAGGGCPVVSPGVRACQDVYEWEAPGTGSCEEGAPPYSPANGGCLYLLSDGTEASPSFFADASASGDDAFVFTRSRLVRQDQDELLDLYDARALGGLSAQNSLPKPVCESPDACRPEPTPPPQTSAPLTPNFHGAGNEKPCPPGRVRRHGRCIKKHRHHHHGRPRR
jgi:hypothetical protein